MRILAIVIGIALMGTGVVCFANSGLLFMSVAFIIGLISVIAGLTGLCAYMFGFGEIKKEAGWFLSEAIISVLLGIIILANQVSTDAAVPFVFGTWTMTSGVLRIVLSVTHRDQMDREELIPTAAMGILGTVAGVYFFFNSMLFNFTVIIIVGVSMMIYGINMLIYGILMPAQNETKKTRKKKRLSAWDKWMASKEKAEAEAGAGNEAEAEPEAGAEAEAEA